jgi:hypothetical protein
LPPYDSCSVPSAFCAASRSSASVKSIKSR